MNKREQLGSRLGFIMLSAGCAIGCGNVWKFPWMCGQYGGGSFMLVYFLCLLLLGLPACVMEFAAGRASKTSPVRMFRVLERPGTKWDICGYACLAGNVALMAFYTVVAGWILYYFCRFAAGSYASLSFDGMLASPAVNTGGLLAVTVSSFLLLSFDMQKGLERITKVMMIALLILLLVLAVRCMWLPGAARGLAFYLVPDFSAISPNVVAAAMNQAFFTLSVGMGGMAIFGSYIGRERALLGEAVHVIALDTFVAVLAGLIMFPACFSYGLEVTAGPSLLFDSMLTVFSHMAGGRLWGSLFFLFMLFAAMSTVLGVCENILAMVRDLTGWSRPKGCIFGGIIVFVLGLTTALGFSVLKFQPFAAGTTWLDFWDFLVSTNILPLGSLLLAVFCCNDFGWGWENFVQEANAGRGMKVQQWMKPLFRFFVPAAILFIYVYGLIHFPWR